MVERAFRAAEKPLVLLALFPVAVFAGLWRRSWRLLAASAALIAIFYLLMLSVAAKSWAN